MLPSAADQANARMVDRMIAEGALWSPPLIAAFRATPRHRFLDRVFQFQRKQQRWREYSTHHPGPDLLSLIYADRALITRLSSADDAGAGIPISSSSQPSLMAPMLEDLKLGPGLSVLEVGAGTGYNAALLAHRVGPDLVTSIDVDREVLAEAGRHLETFADRRLQLRPGDGRRGCAEQAPFDRIMVTAATPDLEPAWLGQLGDRGLLLAPLALAPGLAFIVRGTVTRGAFHGRLTRAAYFMPLRAEDEPAGSATQPAPWQADAARAVPAPWADWFARKRPRSGWLGFIQSLVFYGWLRGLTVSYETLSDNQAAFGVGTAEGDSICWLGAREWRVGDDAGLALAWDLWRAFLDAGGPWPTEFRLHACPPDMPMPDHPPGRRQSYVRHGPICRHLWELAEPRDRPAWI